MNFLLKKVSIGVKWEVLLKWAQNFLQFIKYHDVEVHMVCYVT